MPRHEVPVLTDFVLQDDPPGEPIPEGEHRLIRFEGHHFGWHALESDPDRGSTLPVVSMRSVGDGRDRGVYQAESLKLQRFLSALSFAFDAAIIPIVVGFNNQSTEPDDHVRFRQPGGPLPVPRIHGVPQELAVVPDERLHLALGLRREGRNSLSPFYRFLAFWNALDVVFEGDTSKRNRFMEKGRRSARSWFQEGDPVPANFGAYLEDSSRNAIAHAVRRLGKEVLDPDDPSDFRRLTRDTKVMAELLRVAIWDRWPYPVTVLRGR